MAQKIFTLKGVMDISSINQSIQKIQTTLNKLNLKDNNLKGQFNTIFKDLDTELKNYQKQLQKGFKNKTDVSDFEKTSQKINNLMEKLTDNFKSIEKRDLSKVFNINPNVLEEINEINNEIKEVKNNLKELAKTNLNSLKNSFNSLSTKKAKEGGQLVEQLINRGQISEAKKLLGELINTQESTRKRLLSGNKSTTNVEANINAFKEIKKVLDGIDSSQLEKFNAAASKLTNLETSQIQKLNDELNRSEKEFKEAGNEAEKMSSDVRNITNANQQAANSQRQLNNEIENIKDRIKYFFGLENAILLFRNAVRHAFETVKELDAAMTETAVVTDFTVGDMWKELPRYTELAKELGATTLGAYETMTLFYQQGLKTNEAFEVGTETMKMARIANMDYAETTDLMTAALRGFNMELNETSARRINDVYSELAAITAADTQEIGTAMSKTASIANSANMEFETTAAFLSQIIETTREAPETAGTALKTIIARFTEVKELFSQGQLTGTDSEGEAIEINKIDAALQNVGISLKDFLNGQKGLDDILLELASKWDSLDIATQRYIATTAAGSRQQSRFLAMMGDYDRTMELVSAANNSAGASAKQFEKTQDSLEAKLNKLKDAWDEFTMGLANSTLIKTGIDLLTLLLDTINNITGAFGDGVGGFLKWATLFLALSKGKKIFDSLFNSMSIFSKGIEVVNENGETLTATFKSLENDGSKLKQFFEDIKNLFTGEEIEGIDIDPNELLSKLSESRDNFGEEALKAYDEAVARNIPNMEAAVLLQMSEAEARQFNSRVTNGLTREEIANTVAQMNNNRVTQISNIERSKLIATLLLSGKAKRAEAAVTLGLATAEGTATVATSALGKALLALPLGWIAVGIAAIVATIKILDLAIETDKEKLERLNEEHEKFNSIVEKNKQELGNLKTSLEEIKNIDDTFKGLTVGTLEWKEALVGANEKILELVKNYPELAQYIETQASGLMTIPEEKLDEYYNKRLEQQQKLQAGSILQQREILEQEKKIKEEEIKDAEAEAEKSTYTTGQRAGKKIIKKDEEYKASEQAEIAGLKNEAEGINNEIEGLTDALSVALLDNAAQFSEAEQEAINTIFESDSDFSDFDSKVQDKKDDITETGSDLDDLYKEVIGSLPDEELSDSDKKKAIATAQATEEFYEKANDIAKGITDLKSEATEEQANLIMSALQGQLTQEQINQIETDSLGILTEEYAAYFGLTLEEFTDVINENVEIAQQRLDEANKKIKNIKTRGPKVGATEEEITSYRTKIDEFTLGMSSEQLAGFSEQIERINAYEGGKGVEQYINSIEKMREQLADSPEELNKFNNALSNLDLSSKKSVKGFSTLLKEFITDGKLTTEQINDLENELINLGEASDNINLEALINALGSIKELIADVEGRELDTEREFTQEQYDQFAQLLDPNVLEENFIKTNEGNYVFVGKSLNEITNLLRTSGEKNAQLAQAQIDAQLDIGNRISQLDSSSLKDLTGIGTGEKDITDFSETELQSYNLSLGLGLDTNATKEALYQAIKDAFLQSYGEGGGQLEALRQQQQNFNPYEYTSSATDVYNQTSRAGGIVQQQGIEAIEMKFALEGGREYLNVAKQIVAENHNISISSKELSEETGKYALEVKAVAAEEAKRQKIIEKTDITIEENASILREATKNSEEYRIASRNVSKALTEYLNVPIDEDFITEHLEDIIAMSEGSVEALERIKMAAREAYAESLNGLEDYKGGVSQFIADFNALEASGAFDHEFTISSIYDDAGVLAFLLRLADIQNLTDTTADKIANFQEMMAGLGYDVEVTWKEFTTFQEIAVPNSQGYVANYGNTKLKSSIKVPTFKFKKTGGGSIGGDASAFSTPRSGGSSGSSGGGSSKKEETPWENSFDRLYNIIEDINEEERTRNELELEFNRITEDGVYNSTEILKNLKKQEDSLKRQQKLQKSLLSGRQSEMKSTMSKNSDLQKYAKYNWETETIDINWGKINAVKDEDLGNRIEEYVSELERIQDSMDEANDELETIQDELKELQDVGKEQYEELENKVLDAVIAREQAVIDSLSTINDSINDANSKLLSDLSDSIDRMRQNRQNQETEEQIGDTQNQLAYLQRDTSNANRLEILQTQDQLEQQEEDYTDTLIDQKISELQRQNDIAAEQRARQIEIAQAQLDRDIEQGLFWSEVTQLLNKGVTNDGTLISGSQLESILKTNEDYASLSQFGKNEWAKEIKNTIELADVWLRKNLGIGLSGKKDNVNGPNSGGSSKPSSSKPNTSSKPKQPTVGGMINAKGAYIYATSYGEGKGKQYYSNDPIYKVLGENNGYWRVRHRSQKVEQLVGLKRVM